MEKVVPLSRAAGQLRVFYQRNGYIRRVDPVRQLRDGQLYKKGAEVRLVADSDRELHRIRRLLRLAGFSPGKPFRKGKQWRQPLYGVEAVARFLAMIGERKSARKRSAR